MYKKYKSKNGLNVIVSPMNHMSSVSIGIWIGVGGRCENIKESGISHLIEHMLFKGTEKYSTSILKEAIEGVGGSFNGFTSDEATCYMVKVPAQYSKLGIDILSDMVLNPKVDEKDLYKEKFVVCEEIKMYKDQPAEHVHDVLAELMWPKSALGRMLTGTISNVKRMTKKDLMSFKDKWYHPANITVIVSGKVDPKKIYEYVYKKFSHVKRKNNITFDKVKMNQKTMRIKVLKGDTSQAHIAIGFHAKGSTVKERFAIKLMNVILGGNMSSRLFESLREKKGLCYDVASSYKRHSDVGEIHIHAGVDNKNTFASIKEIVSELKKIKEKGITADELKRAKEYAKGQFLLALEGTSTRMIWLGDRIVVHNEFPEQKDIIKKVNLVTIEDVNQVVKKVFDKKHLNLAVIGKVDLKTQKEIKRVLSGL